MTPGAVPPAAPSRRRSVRAAGLRGLCGARARRAVARARATGGLPDPVDARLFADSHPATTGRLRPGRRHAAAANLPLLSHARWGITVAARSRRRDLLHGEGDLTGRRPAPHGVSHVCDVVRKAGRRPRNFFAPRTQNLEYGLWTGGLRLMQLSALYV